MALNSAETGAGKTRNCCASRFCHANKDAAKSLVKAAECACEEDELVIVSSLHPAWALLATCTEMEKLLTVFLDIFEAKGFWFLVASSGPGIRSEE